MATYTVNKINYDSNTYNLEDANALHSVPIATNAIVGGVKAGGDGISIDTNGVISSYTSITATYDADDKEVILNVGTLADADITEY